MQHSGTLMSGEQLASLSLRFETLLLESGEGDEMLYGLSGVRASMRSRGTGLLTWWLDRATMVSDIFSSDKILPAAAASNNLTFG